MINLSRAAFKNLVANCYADKEADDISREGKGIIYAHERIEELEKALREVRSSIVKSYTDVGLMTPWQAETARIVVSIDKALGDDS